MARMAATVLYPACGVIPRVRVQGVDRLIGSEARLKDLAFLRACDGLMRSLPQPGQGATWASTLSAWPTWPTESVGAAMKAVSVEGREAQPALRGEADADADARAAGACDAAVSAADAASDAGSAGGVGNSISLQSAGTSALLATTSCSSTTPSYSTAKPSVA